MHNASAVALQGLNELSSIEVELAAIEHELRKREGVARLRASIPAKLKPMLEPHRYKGAKGGRGGMKSQTFARLVLLRCLDHPGTRVVCVREIQLSLEQSVKRLLKDLIDEYDLTLHGFEVKETRIITPGEGLIIFQGMQNHTAASIKSLEGFHIAWVEEANTLSATSLELLRPTLREAGSELWFSWNPEKASDPVDALFAHVDALKDGILIEVNWSDNPHLPQELRDEMERDYQIDPELAAHTWGGKYRRRSKATVFKNVRVEAFETPENAEFLFGGDWGFAADPTTLVRMFIPRPRVLCIDALLYEKHVEIDDTAEFFDGLDPTNPRMARNYVIRADSARPELISYLQRHGYPLIEAAKKGPGSVEDGVKFLQGFEIILHPRTSPHGIDEFQDYSFKVHPLTGDVLPVLVDKKNHVIDAVRYALEKVMRGGGWVTW